MFVVQLHVHIKQFLENTESGQKQSVKHLQKMVHSTFQHPPTPHSHTLVSKV